MQTNRLKDLRSYIEFALYYATRTQYPKRTKHGGNRRMTVENKKIARIIRVRLATDTHSLVLLVCPLQLLSCSDGLYVPPSASLGGRLWPTSYRRYLEKIPPVL